MHQRNHNKDSFEKEPMVICMSDYKENFQYKKSEKIKDFGQENKEDHVLQ